MKKCPFCAEEIQDEAMKCRFCGEFIDKEKESVNKQTKVVQQGSIKKCPFCFKQIKADAFKCIFCGSQLKEREFAPIKAVKRSSNAPAISNHMPWSKQEKQSVWGLIFLVATLLGSMWLGCLGTDMKYSFYLTYILPPFVLLLSPIIIGLASPLYPRMNQGAQLFTTALITLAIIWAVIFTFQGCAAVIEDGKRSSSSQSIDNGSVIYHAENFVKAHLVSPRSAKFTRGIIKPQGNGVYGYAGYVDSQNVYGAMIRQAFYVEVAFSGDQCRLLNITMD